MWPYDYFNEYSFLINEFREDIKGNIEKKCKKIFISTKYKDKKFEERENFIRTVIKELSKNRSKFILLNRHNPIKNKLLEHKLRVIMPKDTTKGDININIFGNIIESSLIICDLTPIGNWNKDDKVFRFCDNVLIELGLALAWKSAEQIIVLVDKKFKLGNLPSNIGKYVAHQINFESKNKGKTVLKNIIQDCLRNTNPQKSIVIRNIQNQLDHHSLAQLTKKNGLVFAEKELDGNTARYLLRLGLIHMVIFPAEPPDFKVTYGYSLTEVGRYLIKEVLRLGGQLYPKIIADAVLVRYWKGHNKQGEFNIIKKEFLKEYSISWKDCVGILKAQFNKEKVKVLNDDLEQALEYYSNLKGFRAAMNTIINPVIQKLNRLTN